MSSSPQTDRLLDLLYGELSPEEEAELYRAVEDDEELADELRELRQTHAEVRRNVPEPEEVPEDVAEAILARASREKGDEEEDPVRPPRAVRSEGGLWSRLIESGAARAATSVAVMLLVCGGAYYAMFGLDAPPTPSSSMEDMAGSPAETKGVEGEAEPTEEVAEGEAEQKVEAADEEVEASEDEAREIARQIADDGRDGTEEAARGPDSIQEQPSEPSSRRARSEEPTKRQAPERQKSSASADSKRDDSAIGDLAERDSAQPESAPEPRPQPEKDAEKGRSAEGAAELDTFGGGAGMAMDSDEDRAAEETSEPDEQKEAEDESDIDADQILTDAREALEEGDHEEARRLLEHLDDQVDADDLDDEQRREAEELGRRLEPRRKDAAEEPTLIQE